MLSTNLIMDILALISFPQIDPVAFSLGPLQVRWYALAYVAGLLIAFWYMKKLVQTPRLWAGQKPTLSVAQLDDLFMWIIIAVVVGGRVGYVLVYAFDEQLRDPLFVFKTLDGGMSFHGGFFGVILATYLFGKRYHVDLDRMLDLGAAATPIGLGLGRLANFINGELYGRASDVSWAMIFPTDPLQVPRHPSQLYEFCLEGVGLFLLVNIPIWRSQALSRPGLAAGLFSLGYGLSRILVEMVREPDKQMGYYAQGLTMGMLLSIPMLIIGVWLIVRSRRRAVMMQ